MRKYVLFLLSLYRKMRFGPPSCRYYPSCSHYAETAVQRHGSLMGLFLAFKRLIRCNQLFPGGYDPVP